MKKLIATLTALTALACVFTACGQVEEPADDVSSNVEVTSDTGTEETTAAESSEAVETTEIAQETTVFVSELVYASTVAEYVDVINNADYEKAMKMMFPTDIFEGMKQIEGFDMDEDVSGLEPGTYTLVDITENANLFDDYAEELAAYFSQLKVMLDYVAENGEEAITSYEPDENADTLYKITEIYDVTVALANDNGETADMELLVYYIDGEGWKVDTSLKGYIEASKNQSMNSNARSFYNAANCVLTELDNEGIDVFGTYIISSDTAKNVNVNIDLDKFMADMENWFPDYTNYDFFVVISEGVCVGAYCVDKEESELVGMYPSGRLPVYDGESFFGNYTELDEDASYTYDELYDTFASQLK